MNCASNAIIGPQNCFKKPQVQHVWYYHYACQAIANKYALLVVAN